MVWIMPLDRQELTKICVCFVWQRNSTCWRWVIMLGPYTSWRSPGVWGSPLLMRSVPSLPSPHPGHITEPSVYPCVLWLYLVCDPVLSFWLQVTGISNYFEREVKRRAFVVMRWDFRENEKRELEQEQKRKAGVSRVKRVNWWCRTWFRQLRMLAHTVSWHYPCFVFVN